jgi:ABC-2 type transport system permease protein
MSWRRVKTVVRRLFLVLWRNPARWFDIAVWPLFDVILFGSLGVYVAQETDASRVGATYMLAGIMLFHVLFQSQVGIATGFMEETWSRNLLNLMTTPLTELEYAAGLALYSLLKSVLALSALSLIALGIYGFGLGEIGWGLVPVVAVLLLVGFAVALFNIALMLRFGQAAEIFTWGCNFLLLALSGVFNEVEALPGAIQPVARVLPTTYTFEAARRVLFGEGLDGTLLLQGLVGAVIAVALSFWFVVHMLSTFRKRGYVTRFS